MHLPDTKIYGALQDAVYLGRSYISMWLNDILD